VIGAALLFAFAGPLGALALWSAARSGARALGVPLDRLPLWVLPAAALTAGFAGALGDWSLASAAAGCALVGALTCAVTDVRSGYVFDRALLVAALGVAAFGAGAILTRLLAAAVVGALFAIPFVVSRGRGFGLGDVKLGALLGAGVGVAGGLSAFMASFIAGAAFALIALALGRLDRKAAIPFAPFIALGAAFGLAFPLHIPG
jgi:leader peptidase (prepilin peptidase)/N-methyltransferase